MNIFKKLLSLVCPVENDKLKLDRKQWAEHNGKLTKFTYEGYAIDSYYKLKNKYGAN